MTTATPSARTQVYPAPRAVLELLKPITWFPPMWAFACGVVSSGVPILDNWTTALLGAILAGLLVCALSQAINDWYDRRVDAINEPHRPITSGRVPGLWGLDIAGIWSLLSLAVAAVLGAWVLVATVVGLVLASLVVGQALMMRRFLREPIAQAIWYSGFGVPLYVFGMMASAVAVRGLG